MKMLDKCSRLDTCSETWSILKSTESHDPDIDFINRELRSRDPDPIEETDEQLISAALIELHHLEEGDPEVTNPWDAVVAYERAQLLGFCSLDFFQAGLCETCPLREFANCNPEQ